MRFDDESLGLLRTRIERIAAEEAAGVLAEARAEARAQVRSMLSEAIAASMLEHLRGGPDAAVPAEAPVAAPAPVGRTPQPAAGRAPAPATGTGELGWYVYGVVAADGPPEDPDSPGLDPAHPPTAVREGALAAVASQVALDEFGEAQLREHLADMAWLEHTARSHERVLDSHRARTTVIPMRLCTVYATEKGVREMLRREAEALQHALSYLEHKTEWGVKVFATDRQDSPRSGERTADEAPDSGAAYMEQRRRERGAQLEAFEALEQACQQIHERLSAVAADALLSPPQRREVSGEDAEMVLNGVYLVQDDAQDAFHQTLGELQSEFEPTGLNLEATGPWPAYNFVPGTIGAAW